MQLDSKYVSLCNCHMCTSDIWEERIYIYVCVYLALEWQWLTHSLRRLNSRQKTEREKERKERERRGVNGREEGGEGDHVKKSSSFVCQSFYNDTVVIRIYIHYRASECMTWMYLHFNSERACNLFCTIDLMMWLCSQFVCPSFLDICFLFLLSVVFSLLSLNTIHHHHHSTWKKDTERVRYWNNH